MIPTTSLVASALRYPGKAARIYTPDHNWQAEAYRHYHICGEARFAAKFFGNAISRAVLDVASKETGEIQESGPASDALDALFNGANGQAQMLEAIGIHLSVAGECYLVGRTVDGVDVWEIISIIEMVVAGNVWKIHTSDATPDITLEEDDVVIRIWTPDPARRIEADSPFRSLLPILSEIEWLTRHIFAQVSSRLTGAGLLILPQGVTFPPPLDANGESLTYTNEADGFTQNLGDTMMITIKDPSSPSAQIPIVLVVPDDAVGKIEHKTFWSPLDEHALELRSEAIRRFALGMDLPPEQVLGMSSNSGSGGGTSNGVSHWGAWQIEESTIKMHVEPMLETICNALTIGYLRPIVEDTDPVVVSSSAALRLRPDRSKEAMELYDRGALKENVMLRENGFDETDLPDDDERHLWLLRKIASGSATPEQVQAALAALGVPLSTPPPTNGSGPRNGTRDSRPAPSLDKHPIDRHTPPAALLAASDALVYRALERVGNRLRNAGSRPPGVESYNTHVYVNSRGMAPGLLEDAWSCAPQVLAGIADVDKIVPVLNAYTENLLATQTAHDRGRLNSWLALRKVSA